MSAKGTNELTNMWNEKDRPSVPGRKIDEFPEDTVYLFIQLMDKMSADKKKNEGKQKRKFLQTAGRINIDETAVYQLREESVI